MVGTTPRRPPIFAMLADCFPSFCPASGRRGYLVLVTLCPRRLPAGGPVGCVPWTFLPCCTSPVPRFRPFSLLSSTLAAPRRAPHLTRFALSSVSRCLLVSLSSGSRPRAILLWVSLTLSLSLNYWKRAKKKKEKKKKKREAKGNKNKKKENRA